MTQASETAAICAAINAQFSLSDPAVAPADATALTGDHIIVFASRRFVADRLASGEVTIPGGRVLTRYVSKVGANVSNMQAKARAALEDQIIAGGLGPFTFEAEDVLDDDADGYWTAADVWTY